MLDRIDQLKGQGRQMSHSRIRWSIWLLLGLLSACNAETPAQPAIELPKPTSISFDYAIYLHGDEIPDVATLLAGTLAATSAQLKLVPELPLHPTEPVLCWKLITEVARDYAPPGEEMLRYSSRGLNDEQKSLLSESPAVVVLQFAHPADTAYVSLRAADETIDALARTVDGLIWDEELRLVYTPDAWSAARLATPADALPSAEQHTVIHSYRNGEHIRAVSLGMRKLGLPDLVIERLAPSNGNQLAKLMNGVEQFLIERGQLDSSGTAQLAVDTLKPSTVRDMLSMGWKGNASGSVAFNLKSVPAEEGDADNALFAIRFDAFDGPDEFARQDQAVSAFFGWSDEIKRITHDDALKAASEAARAKLPEIRDRFRSGLPLGDNLQVKAPFEVPGGGSEWMWVEVAAWEGDDIDGLLNNEPFDIPELHSGQQVVVSMADVFDYLLTHADGSTEGNTTAAIIEAMRGETEERGSSGGVE
jgi:uncharacterized protein YegJ (DUF2314 family)